MQRLSAGKISAVSIPQKLAGRLRETIRDKGLQHNQKTSPYLTKAGWNSDQGTSFQASRCDMCFPVKRFRRVVSKIILSHTNLSKAQIFVLNLEDN